MLVYGKYECLVMHMLYACVLYASCGSSQRCVRHNLQFVNAGRICNKRPYRRGILCFIGSHGPYTYECTMPNCFKCGHF